MLKKLLIGVIPIIAVLCLRGAVFADGYDVAVNDVTANETGVTVMLTSVGGAEANVMAASYNNDGSLKAAAVKNNVILNPGEVTTVELDNPEPEKIFVWDEQLRPLCDVYCVSEAEPTSTPSNTQGDGIIYLLGDSINALGVENVTVDGTVVTINAAGTYIIEGSLTDGQIVVSDSLSKSDNVAITLNGVNVASSDSAPFNGAGGKIELTLADGTENTFTDTAKYTNYTSSKEPKGCVYSRRDLDIGGAGTLVVNANVKNGIVCGADLKIKKGANLEVTAVNNAVKGDNGVEFTSKTGVVNITAGGDAIKSDAIDTDTGMLEQDKGYVLIAGGIFTLNADGDGIQADNYCSITGGRLDITSGAEGIKANEVMIPASDDDVAVTDEEGNQVYINGEIVISGGTVNVNAGEDGIKACGAVIISGDSEVNVDATGINALDGTGYDAIQTGESEDVADGSVTTRNVIVPGVINISGGTVNIIGASDDAFVSKGDFIMNGGIITGSAACDFMKIYENVDISGGEIDIVSGCDGIQSGKALIETVTGSEITESGYTTGNVNISGGIINITANGGHATAIDDNTASCKGIKANTELNISGGNITVNSADDSIHSNYNVAVTGGKMELATGDDGVHADYILTLGTEGGSDEDFTIDISTSYEGIEGSVIKILSGTQYLYATDDGINAAGDYTEDGQLSAQSASGAVSAAAGFGGNSPGGNPGGNFGGGSGNMGPGQTNDDTSPYGMMYIKGGKTYVEAYGDGLDSNGSAEMSGGVVLINGPSSGSNGVFDIGDSSDCYFNVTGGTLIGEGSSAMQVTPTVSGQGYVKSGSSSSGSRPGSSSVSSGNAGSPVRVNTDNGNIVFVPKVSWGYMFITTPDMTSGKSYSISQISSYSDGTEVLGKTVNNIFYGLLENCD